MSDASVEKDGNRVFMYSEPSHDYDRSKVGMTWFVNEDWVTDEKNWGRKIPASATDEDLIVEFQVIHWATEVDINLVAELLSSGAHLPPYPALAAV